jgi:DNA-binding Lrp family transcriptional regulator
LLRFARNDSLPNLESDGERHYNRFGTSHGEYFHSREVISVSAKAFILIETAGSRSKEVSSQLSKLKGVESVDPVTGPYDIIARVSGEDLNDIGDLITGKIHNIPGINRTVTCLVIKSG